MLTQNEWNEKQRAKRVQEFAPPSSYEARIPQDANTLYFTTKKLKSEKPKEYNSVPIQFEYDIEKVHKNDPITDKRKKGVEVPPPVSYENTTSVKKPNKMNMSDSIEAGLNYLKNKEERKNKQSNRKMFDIL